MRTSESRSGGEARGDVEVIRDDQGLVQGVCERQWDEHGRVLTESFQPKIRISAVCLYSESGPVTVARPEWSAELPFRSAGPRVTRVVLTDEEGSPIAECRPIPEEVAVKGICRAAGWDRERLPIVAVTQDGVWHRCEWMARLSAGTRVIVQSYADETVIDVQTVVVNDAEC